MSKSFIKAILFPHSSDCLLLNLNVYETFLSVPPKILPIQPMTNLLREGMRAAISCQILEGDLPVTFRWERDGHAIPSAGSSGSLSSVSSATTRRLDEYSSSLVIEKLAAEHAGNYTCVAQNVAGTESFTVPLTVNGMFG